MPAFAGWAEKSDLGDLGRCRPLYVIGAACVVPRSRSIASDSVVIQRRACTARYASVQSTTAVSVPDMLWFSISCASCPLSLPSKGECLTEHVLDLTI